MNKFLKENWFKFGLFLLLFLVVATVSFYYVFFLPKQLKDQANHNLQMECRSLGEKIDKEINPPDNPIGQIPYTPEYFYNRKLGKCFYYGGYDDHIAFFQIIIDANTNKEMASCRVNIKEETELEAKQHMEFDRKKMELFKN